MHLTINYRLTTIDQRVRYNRRMNPPHEIRPLTALRAIAALLVFLSHYSGLHYERAAQPWQSIIIEGHAGVTIFFVLSGFLITLRYLPDIQARQFSTYDYFLKR